MHRFLKSIILLAVLQGIVYAQGYIVEYSSVPVYMDVINSSNLHARKHKVPNSGETKLLGTLTYSQGISFFTYASKNTTPSKGTFVHYYSTYKQYYKDFRNKRMTVRAFFGSSVYIIHKPLHGLKFELTEETQEIGGYKCKKAYVYLDAGINFNNVFAEFGGLQEKDKKDENNPFTYIGKVKKNTVWYTEEIPIPDGFKGYYGLPGLIIMEETDHFGHHNIMATKITRTDKKLDIPKIVPQKKEKVMSEEDFKAMFNKKTEAHFRNNLRNQKKGGPDK